MSVPEYMDYNTIRQESSECYQTRIRHATVDRLLDRLTDLRFLSIDFLNTFLLTYRVFTTGITVLEALKKVYKNPDCCGNLDSSLSSVSGQSMTDQDIFSESPPNQTVQFTVSPPDNKLLIRPQPNGRRISTGCMKNEITGDTSNAERLVSTPSIFHRFERGESTESDDSRPDLSICLVPPKPKLAPIASCETLYDHEIPDIEIPAITTTEIFPNLMLPDESDEPFTNVYEDYEKEGKLLPPTISGFGSSSETLTEPLTPPLLSSAPSSDTLTPGSPIASPMSSPMSGFKKTEFISSSQPSTPVKTTNSLDSTSHSPMSSPTKGHIFKGPSPPIRIPMRSTSPRRATSPSFRPTSKSPTNSPKLRRAPSPVFGYSYSSPNMIISQVKNRPFSGKRGSAEAESISTPRSSFTQIEGSPPKAKAGTVVTSSRQSKRRSSSSAATTAFAAATAGSANPADHTKGVCRYLSAGAADNKFQKKRESVISTAATMRVLNVLKHWVSKHQQDFESGHQLKAAVIDLLEEMVCNTTLLPAEHKAAGGILRTITMENTDTNQVDLEKLLVPPATSSKDTFDSLSALDIAEQLTYLDHKIFVAIRSEELLSQAWMKPDKENKAPHVLLVSKRFNEVSRLVVSEIVSRSNLQDRVSCIEKWAAIADICRCMHNYNGVLQICAAFVNSSVYRLKKTWERLSKQTKQMIERLQTLVSSEGRFKNMRDALHRCDPPCIPYLGMYLTDLSFIEEGTPNFTEDKLVNFSKMRMIAHVIREIRLFQQTPYRIEHHSRITNYLLDLSRLLLEDQAYKASLEIEPKQSRLSVVTPP